MPNFELRNPNVPFRHPSGAFTIRGNAVVAVETPDDVTWNAVAGGVLRVTGDAPRENTHGPLRSPMTTPVVVPFWRDSAAQKPAAVAGQDFSTGPLGTPVGGNPLPGEVLNPSDARGDGRSEAGQRLVAQPAPSDQNPAAQLQGTQPPVPRVAVTGLEKPEPAKDEAPKPESAPTPATSEVTDQSPTPAPVVVPDGGGADSAGAGASDTGGATDAGASAGAGATDADPKKDKDDDSKKDKRDK